MIHPDYLDNPPEEWCGTGLDHTVTFRPKVTSGVERGGEDLEIEVEAYYCHSDPPNSVLGIRMKWDFDGRGFNHREDQDGRVTLRTYYDEHEWTGKLDDVMELKVGDRPLREVLADPNSWSFDHKPGEPARLVFRTKIFIDGNAE